MKNLKKALLSTAILAGLSAGNAFAGTEACFEVYSVADNAGVTAFGDVYASAACVAEDDRVAATTTDLAPTDSIKVAYELTKSLTLDFDAATSGGTDDLHIVYIPTTDIPGGTKITMKLAGATFAGNSNQIHLVKEDGVNIAAVASSDGAVDGQSTITFITKAGITIGAGTRLAFSRISNGLVADVDPVGVKLENATCTDGSSTSKVTIQATEAKTDGGTGYVIAGGQSAAQEVIDSSAQFVTFIGSATVDGQVNAESKNFDDASITARTEFVYDTAADAGLTLKKASLVHKAGFADRAAELDYPITRDADDELELSFVESADAGASVKAEVYNTRTNPGGVLAAAFDLNGATAGTALDFVSAKPASAQVSLSADDIFSPVSTGAETAPAAYAAVDYNEVFFTVSQTDLTKIMNFNYEVTAHAKLNLDAASELDHCDVSKVTHKVGVNGAVLKVPYTVAGTGNFVRITNEHTVAAEVTVDLFSETADGTTGNRAVTAVKLDNVPAKSSVVYYVPDVVQAAVDQMSYAGSDGNTVNGANVRHTMTFTVTSPKNTVHGVSVQKLSTGQDRVMPVLDQNDWAQ